MGASTIVQPLDLVKNRMQVGSVKNKNEILFFDTFMSSNLHYNTKIVDQYETTDNPLN